MPVVCACTVVRATVVHLRSDAAPPPRCAGAGRRGVGASHVTYGSIAASPPLVPLLEGMSHADARRVAALFFHLLFPTFFFQMLHFVCVVLSDQLLPLHHHHDLLAFLIRLRQLSTTRRRSRRRSSLTSRMRHAGTPRPSTTSTSKIRAPIRSGISTLVCQVCINCSHQNDALICCILHVARTCAYHTHRIDLNRTYLAYISGTTHAQLTRLFCFPDQYWGTKPVSASCKGPILFYTGNEGDMCALHTRRAQS